MSSFLASSHYLPSCDTRGTLTCSPCPCPSCSWLAALWGQVSWPFFWDMSPTAAVFPSFTPHHLQAHCTPGSVTAGDLAAVCSHCCQVETASFLISSDMGQLWSHHLFPLLLLSYLWYETESKSKLDPKTAAIWHRILHVTAGLCPKGCPSLLFSTFPLLSVLTNNYSWG